MNHGKASFLMALVAGLCALLPASSAHATSSVVPLTQGSDAPLAVGQNPAAPSAEQPGQTAPAAGQGAPPQAALYGMPLNPPQVSAPKPALNCSQCPEKAHIPTPEEKKAFNDQSHYQDMIAAFTSCAAGTDRAGRLDCYDDIATKAGVMKESTQAEQRKVIDKIGFWEISSQYNDVGREVISLKLQPVNSVTLGTSVKKMPEFIIKCSDRHTDAYVDWKGPLSYETQYVKHFWVTVRIDSGDSADQMWDLSIDKRAVFAPSAVDFIKQLKTASRLQVQLTPVHESEVTLVYGLQGFNDALDILVKRCYN
jgi:hypothetical protein